MSRILCTLLLGLLPLSVMFGQQVDSVLVDSALFYASHQQIPKAVDCLEQYMQKASRLSFDKQHKDKNMGHVAYYGAMLAYGIKDYGKAEYFADIALRDGHYAKEAAEIKVSCMKHYLTNHEDSTRYLIALLELHDKAPENDHYVNMLMEYFLSPGHEEELGQFAHDELHKDSTNKTAWSLVGEVEMRAGNWDAAIKDFEHAVRFDSTSVEYIYNIGVCYSQKASAEKDSVQRERWLQLSKEYLEKTRHLDPDRHSINWALPLYQVYYLLNDEEKARELKEMVDEKKN